MNFDLPLAEALDFTLGDLRANHEGYLSKRQRELFRRLSWRVSFDWMREQYFILVVMLWLCLFWVCRAAQPILCPPRGCLGTLIVSATLPIPYWAVRLLRRWVRVQLDVDTEALVVYEGRVYWQQGFNSYQLCFEREQWPVPRRLFFALEPDKPYRLHYLARSHVIVSAEPLHEVTRVWRPMVPVEKP
ncbi:MAG: hypothetical protein JW910_04085 [Anaerolineae bacterium]|nr:hypothetical protein [Anaerolineae bacterium]